MTDPESPSEDSDLPQLPPNLEARHQSEMTADLMEQLAPLLVADGIDLDNLGNVDVDELNDAMERAVERHNLELNTPVGDERARTINTIRDIANALHQEKTSIVQQIFGSIEPTPTRHKPSSGHLTGVSMEILDQLYGNKRLRSALGVVRLPQLGAKTKAAAQDIQSFAAQQRAFNSLDTLMLNHGGFEIARASVYLITATVAAIADYGKVAFESALEELVPGQKAVGGFPQSSPSGSAPAQHTGSHDYSAVFKEWLMTVEELPEDAPQLIENFEIIVGDAENEGIDLHAPQQLDAWLLSVRNRSRPYNIDAALDILHSYVHFRLSYDPEPQRWNDVHDEITMLTGIPEDPPWNFEKILTSAYEIDPELRYEAIKTLPIIRGLVNLPTWLGTSQPVTTTGAPKRADIQAVAAMIGLELYGVDAMPERNGRGCVRSAQESPGLMAWWRTLVDLEIIEKTATRVRPGPLLQHYVDAGSRQLQELEAFVATYIFHLLMHQVDQIPVGYLGLQRTVTRLVESMGDKPILACQEPYIDGYDAMIEAISTGLLNRLYESQLLERVVPEPIVALRLYIPMVLGLVLVFDDLYPR